MKTFFVTVCLPCALLVSGLTTGWASSVAPDGVEAIYSNFGTGKDKYDATTVWAEQGKNSPAFQIAIVFGFTPQKSYHVTEIQVAAAFAREIIKGHTFKLVLAEDEGVPGRHVFEQKITKLWRPGRCCKVATVMVPPDQAPTLTAHKRYWLEMLPSPNTSGGWYWNSTRTKGIQSTSADGGKTWQGTSVDRHPNGAFAVYGTPTGN